MELGQKIRQARQELGLSQRQLCDGKITRNMLSQIENGTARPSMDTLGYLASRLGKSVSYFLEDQAVVSPNLERMEQARHAFSRQETRKALELLRDFREPDGIFDWERQLLTFLCCLNETEDALSREQFPYARERLEQASMLSCAYITEAQKLQLQLLRQRAGLSVSPADLQWDALLLSQAALAQTPERAVQLLNACSDISSPDWQLAMGQALFAMEDYADAKDHFLCAQDAFPKESIPKLEICFRELGDYKSAYEYACLQRAKHILLQSQQTCDIVEPNINKRSESP